MNQMTIIRGFGVPAARVHLYKRYPWETLSVGDAFIIDSTEAKRVANASFHRKRKTGEQYAIRKINSTQHAVVRVG